MEVNIAILLLPYFIVLPLSKFTELMNNPIPEFKRSTSPLFIRFIKVRLIIGRAFMIAATLGCIYIIFVASANKSQADRDVWMFEFILTFG